MNIKNVLSISLIISLVTIGHILCFTEGDRKKFKKEFNYAKKTNDTKKMKNIIYTLKNGNMSDKNLAKELEKEIEKKTGEPEINIESLNKSVKELEKQISSTKKECEEAKKSTAKEIGIKQEDINNTIKKIEEQISKTAQECTQESDFISKKACVAKLESLKGTLKELKEKEGILKTECDVKLDGLQETLKELNALKDKIAEKKVNLNKKIVTFPTQA